MKYCFIFLLIFKFHGHNSQVNAVFAADAVARLSGTVGVAAVTAGPGRILILNPFFLCEIK